MYISREKLFEPVNAGDLLPENKGKLDKGFIKERIAKIFKNLLAWIHENKYIQQK